MLMFTVTFVICNVNTQTHTFMQMVFQHKSPVTLFNGVNVELKLMQMQQFHLNEMSADSR